jgi:primosomal replication protein N
VSCNRVELDGKVVASDSLRYTPAGIPVLQFKLAHVSQQIEAGRERTVNCEIEAMAFGDVATRIARLPPESRVKLSGFLDRKGARNPMPNLHVIEFEIDIKE